MKKHTDYVLDREGNAVAGAEVYVKDGSNNLITLYSDNGSTETANPLTTDNDGEFSFFAADGTYKLQVYVEGVQQQEVNNFQHYDATDAEIAALRSVTSAADKLFYFTGSGTGAVGDFTAFARTLVDDADAAAARTTLGLAIGTNVQAYDAELAAIASLTSAADKGIQFTGSGTASTYDLTAAGKALLDDADAAAQRTTLGLGTSATMAEEWALNFTSDGDVYIPATAAMTVDQGNDAIGSATYAFEKSTSAAPGTFSSTTLPSTLEAGAWLKVSASSVTGFAANHLKRTA